VSPLYFTLAAVFGYLLGSIPFGLVIVKAAGLGDIRAIGSGNIGATNVLRTGRKDLALATLLLDAGKAGIALLIARAVAGDDNPYQVAIGLTAGAAAFIGHCFPVWLKFNGGKGVATFFGVLFAGVWPLGVISGITWLAVATMFRMSSLAALCAAAIAPIAALVAGFSWAEIIFSAAIAVLIFWRHSANISRIIAGTEPRIGDKKAPTEEAPQPPEPVATPAPDPVTFDVAPEPIAPTSVVPETAPVIEEPAPEPIAAAPPEPTPVDPTPAASAPVIEEAAPEPEPAPVEPEPITPEPEQATPEIAAPAEPKPET
jgi:glycerol-3-phosphate acyltransferase PlsY